MAVFTAAVMAVSIAAVIVSVNAASFRVFHGPSPPSCRSRTGTTPPRGEPGDGAAQVIHRPGLHHVRGDDQLTRGTARIEHVIGGRARSRR